MHTNVDIPLDVTLIEGEKEVNEINKPEVIENPVI